MALRSVPPRKSSLNDPAIREFLDGLAVLIAQRIREGLRDRDVEYAAKAASGGKAC